MYLSIAGYGVLINVIILSLVDVARTHKKRKKWEDADPQQNKGYFTVVTEAVLLDDDAERPIRTWELKGKISLLIGKDGKDHPVDIDLNDTEYSALVDEQHATLNYVSGDWYVEDLYSKNGLRIRKREDGACYKIAKDKPCKVVKGDILLVANTKLLFR